MRRLLTRTMAKKAPTATRISRAILKTSTETAKELAATGVWRTSGDTLKLSKAEKALKEKGATKGKKPKKPVGDKARVNVVSEKLCDDIIKYVGPSLERHRGCDLIDINPGVGLWSRQLHDFLEPRSHTLMEPDADLYAPFLQPLLDRPNTQLLKQSGIVWKELSDVLERLEGQTQAAQPSGPAAAPERNDTLLVTANLSYHPKKRYRLFESVTQLVMYQLLNSIRTSSLFQRYGLVRMLVWVGPEEPRRLLPRNMQERRKMGIEGELSCEWITEVASRDAKVESNESAWFVRDRWIELDAARAVAERMEEAGPTIPEGREHELRRLLREEQQRHDAVRVKAPQAGVQPPMIVRPFLAELDALEKGLQEGKFVPPDSSMKTRASKEWNRLMVLRHQKDQLAQGSTTYLRLLTELRRIGELRQSGALKDGELEASISEWNEEVGALGKNHLSDFRIVRDNLHLFLQDPPALHWDRRAYDPLAVRADEFFPNVECTLLDIQPKPIHPLLRQKGPGTSRAGDIFELLLQSMLMSGMDPVSKAVARIWPGAVEWILPRCPSLRDPKGGGMPGEGHSELTVRLLNERQWMELLEAFMSWPFRPSYEELIGRIAEDVEYADDENTGAGSSFSADSMLS
ncbi:hypothetical protein CH63R_09699 [Colletotrichum higginsianum IMI 349063]|uniref:rRNA adenine N(6)-methyltransferase n=1 Tax=Colletotrichum higginsianum (strain IMI 349063) TaxID=759273 RepID=A0A1B7Y0P2_COLHI|nr:uncharacterized protein CH63R_09699 [Colletotrichum higginsianum IMI 349063]OBR05579.1 hypothetical protein CH63R_09699 [Colletotrichum higginsianum IMI 349063]